MSRRLEGIALVLIAASAILFQQSATASWFEAHAANGHRMLVSPIGVQDWGPDTADRPAGECRWWPKLGDAQLCALAPGGEAAMLKLRRVYPLTFVSLWTSVVALFLIALTIPRLPRATGIAVAASVPILSITALYSLASGTNRALAALANADLQPELRGFGSVSAGAVLMIIAVGLLFVSRVKARPPTVPQF